MPSAIFSTTTDRLSAQRFVGHEEPAADEPLADRDAAEHHERRDGDDRIDRQAARRRGSDSRERAGRAATTRTPTAAKQAAVIGHAS